MPRVIEGKLSAEGMRFGIVVSRFNHFVTKELLSGAIDAIVRHGGDESKITVVHVPGSYEIPLICKKLASSGDVDAVIALGAVIKGATSHFDVVAGGATSGIQQVSLETQVPVLLGVITTDTIEQAIERSGTKAGNKGADAAVAAIEMVSVLKQLKGAQKPQKVAAI